MNVFDHHINLICSRIVDRSFHQGNFRVFRAFGDDNIEKEKVPLMIGKGANRGIILRSDAIAELGNPELGSCSILLFTSDTSIVRDGRITLIGPDIIKPELLWHEEPETNLRMAKQVTGSETKTKYYTEVAETAFHSLPFAQIVIVGGSCLEETDYERIKTALIIGDQIEGYMERSQSVNIWSRVSKVAVDKGFSLLFLGESLITILKQALPGAQAVEIAFVTESRRHIAILDEFATQVRKIARELLKNTWKIKGYDFECESECAICDDKPVCDEIREMLKEKRKNEI